MKYAGLWDPMWIEKDETLSIQLGGLNLWILFAPWFAKADYVALRNSLLVEVKRRFDEEGIEIPFPHSTLYTGAVTEPFPIKLVPSDAVPPDSK